MASIRQQKVSEELRKMAGEFIASHAGRGSLITPTRVDISPDLKRASIFFTVLPATQEENALSFLKRNRSEFRQYLKKIHFKVLPFVDFEIDYGEKNRQVIDAINID